MAPDASVVKLVVPFGANDSPVFVIENLGVCVGERNIFPVEVCIFIFCELAPVPSVRKFNGPVFPARTDICIQVEPELIFVSMADCDSNT